MKNNLLERVYYEQTKGVYVNRAFGGNCYHCITDGDIDAGITAGKKPGQGSRLPVEP